MDRRVDRDEVFTLAQRQHQSGRVDEAEHLYRQLLERDPNDDGALHFLGVLYSQRKQYESAIKLINKSLCLKPAEAAYLSNQGNVLRLDEQYLGAHWTWIRLMQMRGCTVAQVIMPLWILIKHLAHFLMQSYLIPLTQKACITEARLWSSSGCFFRPSESSLAQLSRHQ